MSTFPLDNNVAVWLNFAVLMLPVTTKTPCSTVVRVVPAVPVVVPELVAPPVVPVVPAELVTPPAVPVVPAVPPVAVGASSGLVAEPSLPPAPPASTVGAAHTHAAKVPAEVHVWAPV
jgi:hypothetical protein